LTLRQTAMTCSSHNGGDVHDHPPHIPGTTLLAASAVTLTLPRFSHAQGAARTAKITLNRVAS
jgi:hypothetical protein